MRVAREFALKSRHLGTQSVFGLFLSHRADAQADPHPEVSLVDESCAIGEDGDTRRACRGHELLLPRRRSIFEMASEAAQVIDQRIPNPQVG